MTETTRKPAVEVALMTDGHADSVAEFSRAVWDPGATSEKVRQGRTLAIQSNPFFPGQDIPTVLFLSDGRVLGYCGSIPVAVWSGGEERRADWVKGLMVLPDHRNGPIGFALVKELLRRLERPLSLVVGAAPRRLFEALGMTDLGMLPNFLRLLNSGAVLKRIDLEALGASGVAPWLARAVRLTQRMGMAPLLGACADATFRLKRALNSLGGRSFEIDLPTEFPCPAELDALWQTLRAQIAVSPVRDSRYLPWRYGSTSEYRIVTVRSGRGLMGFAAVRRPRDDGDPRLKGIRISVLSELLFPPDRADIAAAIFRGAEVAAHQYGADALLCSASHPAMVTYLPRQGYLRAPSNLHFMLADKAGRPGLPRDLSAWWITRGDSNADEVF